MFSIDLNSQLYYAYVCAYVYYLCKWNLTACSLFLESNIPVIERFREIVVEYWESIKYITYKFIDVKRTQLPDKRKELVAGRLHILSPRSI